MIIRKHSEEIVTKKQCRFHWLDARITAASMLVPVVCMLIIYGLFQVFPFGDRTVLVMDLNGQYADFLMYYHRVLTGGDSLFYSFTKEMGGNVFGLFSYYLSSPFCLLMLFFPATHMPEAVALITLLKIGCCGLTFSLFLQYTFQKKDWFVIAAACAYALMTYSMHYAMCFMWLDGVIWLPMILLGLERIMEKKSPVLFVAAYALSLISNYYTGYMNTLFAAVYFLFRYATKDGEKSVKDFFAAVGKIVGFGTLGLLLTVGILFPTFMDILQGKLSGGGGYLPEGFWNSGIFQIHKRLFLGQYDTITNDGSPNIFCGALCAMLSVVYFFNSNVRKREKIAAGLVCLLFFASFFVMRLDIAWHIFQYPTWYPYRYAYAFNLFAILLAYQGFQRMTDRNWSVCISGMLVYLALLFHVYVFDPEVLTNKTLALATIAFALVYLLLLFGIKCCLTQRSRLRALLAGTVLALTCVELIINGYTTMQGLNGQFPYKSRSEYAHQVETITNALHTIEEKDPGFYRTEKTISRTDNDSMSFGYRGMTHYSSTYNRQVVNFNNRMGMLQESVLIRYLGSTIVTDSLLGVKYLVADSEIHPLYEAVDETADYQIYENPFALSIGFAAKETALQGPRYTGDFLENQNLFANSVLGTSVLERADTLTDPAAGTLTFTADRTGSYYLEFSKKYGKELSVTVNGTPRTYTYEQGHEKKIYCLGAFLAGDLVQVSVPYTELLDGAAVYAVNEDAFSQAIASVQKNSMLQITDFGNTWLEGSVTLEDGDLLFTTIPFEPGWQVYIDGEKTEAVLAQDVFLAVKAAPGTHTVKLKFVVPGLKLSMLVSVCTLIGVCAAWYLLRKKHTAIDVEDQKESGVSE